MIEIRQDDLSGPEVADLLRVHLETMTGQSPPESTHVLDLESLRVPEISFWAAWLEDTVVGTGAIKELSPHHGEIKSMHTREQFRGQGVARRILEHIVSEANRRGYQRLSLETGSMLIFEPARALYLDYGFSYCAPFAGYREDPNSVFMTKEF